MLFVSSPKRIAARVIWHPGDDMTMTTTLDPFVDVAYARRLRVALAAANLAHLPWQVGPLADIVRFNPEIASELVRHLPVGTGEMELGRAFAELACELAEKLCWRVVRFEGDFAELAELGIEAHSLAARLSLL